MARPTHTLPAGDLSPEKVLLGLLSQRPTHGYALHHRLTTELGQLWHLSPSQVYATLARLEKRELIAGRDLAPAGAPRRREYALTEAGRRELQAWLETQTAVSMRAIRIEFTTRLYLAQAVSPSLARRLVAEQRNAVAASRERCQALLTDLADGQPINRLALRLRQRALDSILDWLAECEATLTTPHRPPPA
jgi:DNA-binding PadR family transcriptional regulator